MATVEADVAFNLLLLALVVDEWSRVGVVPAGESDFGGAVRVVVEYRRRRRWREDRDWTWDEPEHH